MDALENTTTSGLPSLEPTLDPMMDGMKVELNSTPLERWQYTVIAVYLTFVGAFATTGNIVVICVLLIGNRFKRNPHQYIILNLAVSDLGISVFGYPFTTAAAYAGRWLIGHTGCIVYGFTCTTMALTNINSLLVLSVYRYISVCKPNLRHCLSNKRVVMLAVSSCWMYSLSWSLAPLIGWSSYDFELFGTSCSIKWNGRAAGDVTYTVLMTAGCYISHIAVMGYCYYNVIKTSSRALTNLKNPMNTHLARDVQKPIYDLRTTWMVLTMICTFTIVWSPYAWVAFWSMLNPDSVPVWMFTLPTLFAKSSCMLNPFIYVATDRTFREAAKSLLFRQCGKGEEPPSDRIYNIKISPALETQRVCFVNTTDAGVYIGHNEIRMLTSPGIF